MDAVGEDYREAFDLFDASQSGVLDRDEVTMVRDATQELCLSLSFAALRARLLTTRAAPITPA